MGRKKGRKYSKAVMLYLTEGMYAAIQKMAENEERPVSNQLRYILREYITARTIDELSK
jgi:hypothetical protein